MSGTSPTRVRRFLKAFPPAVILMLVAILVIKTTGERPADVYDLTNPAVVEQLEYRYPNVAEAVRKDIPQDSSGQWVLVAPIED